MSQLTEAFKKQWHASDKSCSEEQAMNWFYSGVAAQKEISPPVRLADAVAFASMRRGDRGFRPAVEGPVTEAGSLFLEIIRNLNFDFKTSVPVSTSDLDRATSFIERMVADGCKFNQLSASNFVKGRDGPYQMYDGYTGLRVFIDEIVKRYKPS